MKNKLIDVEVMEERKRVSKEIGFSTIYDARQNDAVKLLVEEYQKRLKSMEQDKKNI